MKKLVLALATTALLASAGSALAGDHGLRHQHGAQMQHMLTNIDASDAQRQQIKTILESNRESMTSNQTQLATAKRALRALDPTASNYNSEVARLADDIAAGTRQATIDRAAIRAQVAAVLTPEQRATLEAKREARMQKHQDRWQKPMEPGAGQDAK